MREIKSCYKKVFRKEDYNKSSIRINSTGCFVTLKENKTINYYFFDSVSLGRWTKYHELEIIERVKPWEILDEVIKKEVNEAYKIQLFIER